MRLQKIALGLCLVGYCSVSLAATSSNAASGQQLDAIDHKIDQMEQKIDHLKGQVHHLKHKLKKRKQKQKNQLKKQQRKDHQQDKNTQTLSKIFSSVSLGEYTGVPNYFDGRKLVVNAPSILEDYKLLERRQQQVKYYQKNDLGYAGHPRMIFSGEIEGAAQYRHDYTNNTDSDINLSTAAIDTYIEVNPWISGLIDISYDDADSQTTSNRVENANLFLDRAFLTVGNLNKTAFFSSIGQLDIPFGRYSSSMISSPLTEFVGKIKTRAITLGYRTGEENSPYANAFVYHGAANNSSNINDAGADVGYLMQINGVKADLGGSFVNNIADAKGFQGTGLSSPRFRGFDHDESLDHVVPGADVYGRLSFDKLTFLGEYVKALRHFASSNLSFDGHGAQPSAWQAEATYGFHVGQHPSSISVAYQGSQEALGINIPRARYSTVLQIALMRHTLLKMEFRHDLNYSSSKTAQGQGVQAYDPDHLGHSANAVTAELAMYF